MKNIIIEIATKQDAQFLLDNTDLTSDLLNRKLKYKEILIAMVDEKPVGLLIYEYFWSHIPFIAQIWIHTDYRKTGIGKSMLNYFEKYLNINNHTMLLSSSMENNKKAQAWHRHMGFKDCGSIYEINDDNTDEVFFKKLLKRDSQRIA